MFLFIYDFAVFYSLLWCSGQAVHSSQFTDNLSFSSHLELPALPKLSPNYFPCCNSCELHSFIEYPLSNTFPKFSQFLPLWKSCLPLISNSAINFVFIHSFWYFHGNIEMGRMVHKEFLLSSYFKVYWILNIIMEFNAKSLMHM